MTNRVRLGDMVTFKVKGYAQTDEVIGRTQCVACGDPVLVTAARVILNEDGRAVHAHD